jgi:hypothetical protein
MPTKIRRALAAVPPVAWRDRRIAALEERLSKLKEASVRPSYDVKIETDRRLHKLRVELDAPVKSANRDGKFAIYDFVASHGVDIPKQFGQWEDATEIPWDDLPDFVVIKSAHGSTSRGVFPVRRVGDGWQVATQSDVVPGEKIGRRLAWLEKKGRVGGPFGAEEFLEGPDGPGSLPIDIKAYTFYGEVPVLLLCERDEHARSGGARYRYIDPAGRDTVGIAEEWPTDFTIEPPANIGDVVEAASRLSHAFREPFLRIDLYSIGRRVVFGEVTPRPGDKDWFGPKLDATLGDAWERAQIRLERDLATETAAISSTGPTAG